MRVIVLTVPVAAKAEEEGPRTPADVATAVTEAHAAGTDLGDLAE